VRGHETAGPDGRDAPGGDGMRHEAFLYGDDDEFLDTLTPFLREGLADGELVAAVIAPDRSALLRRALGSAAADLVAWVDATRLGRNPTRLIAAWHQFIDENLGPGQRLRAVGQPVWPGRSAAELVECHHHEVLANVSFADVPVWVMCPYDTSALDSDVIDDARRSHPLVAEADGHHANGVRYGFDEARATLTRPLPGELPPAEVEMEIDRAQLSELRQVVAKHASGAGLSPARVDDLVLAVDEVATNSVTHGGGHGVLRAWTDGDTVIHEVRDGGHIDEPLVGRRRPAPGQTSGRGLWVVNELCDLVQLRSSPTGTLVRLHMRRQ
jgi:anti-sigma regulatory factor (Ser/Thr protein kinase)